MNNFLNAVENETTKTLTENGALTYSSSLNANLDLFFMASAMRNRINDIESLFLKAYGEEPTLALANMYYARDIRGGQGERAVFKEMLKTLAKSNPDVIDNSLLEKIGLYGRYDDMLVLLDTHFDLVISFIRNELSKDNSLLAKWLPSENTSSKDTKMLALKIINGLGISNKEYRKTLSRLRKAQNLVETKLTIKDYETVDYSKMPSKALLKYRKAFAKNDNVKYENFFNAVKSGEAKVNTATLTPVDIVSKVRSANSHSEDLQVVWDNLPDYFDGVSENSLVVADTSGSMSARVSPDSSVTCLDVSLSLAIYFAERNKGIFHNNFITFSSRPQLVKLNGSNLFTKLKSFKPIIDDTNIEAVFTTILEACEKNNVPQEECPKRIYIISDMEFNSATDYNSTNYDYIKKLYKNSNYEMPEVIFWNAQSRHNNVPVRFTETNVALVSGFSPSILKSILGNEELSPISIMMKTLNRYID